MGVTDLVLRPEVAYVAGGGMILLAALLTVIDPRNRVVRAFSVFLILRGVANLPRVVVDPIDTYLIMLLPFAALWFLIENHRRARLRKGHPLTLVVLAALAFLVLFAWESGIRTRLPDWLHLLNLLFPARFLAYALIAFALAQGALIRERPEERWPFLAMSAAFALNPLYYSLIWFRQRGVTANLAVPAYAGPHLLILLAFAFVCATVFILTLRVAWRPLPGMTREALTYQAFMLGVVLSALLVLADPAWNPEWTARGLAFDRLWTLPVPFLVGYILLRHRLLGLDLRLKTTLVPAFIVGTLGVAFFMSKEILEDLIPLQGNWLGLMGAGAVGLAFRPLERGARRLADRLMPGVAPTPEYLERRRLEVYRCSVETLLQDARLTAKERLVLDRLQDGLGIAPTDAMTIEAEVASRIASGVRPPTVAVAVP